MGWLGIDPDKVDGPGPSWSGTYVGQFLSEQGIDQAGFSHVGPAQEGKLRRSGSREIFRVGSRDQKFSDDGFSRQSWYW